MQAAGQSN